MLRLFFSPLNRLIGLKGLRFLAILSPEGNCESSDWEGLLDSLSILYVIDEQKLGFQKYTTISDFLKVPKTFIPRRELRKQCPRGSNWQSFHFNMWLRSKIWSQFWSSNRPFWSHDNLYCPDGWVGRWMGGDHKCPSIFAQI